ncbi:hypothetical protein F5Y04DRAFT_255374 [Hypomontagnella monticulosa]|nr:hypothetical protein F5Y04DRAFT_255374 [Hypomontagnella monticulosa]
MFRLQYDGSIIFSSYKFIMRRVVLPRSSPEFPFSKFLVFGRRPAGSQTLSQEQQSTQHRDSTKSDEETSLKKDGKKKTMAELDAELQQKMSGLSGDGGEAGVEYENGKPVAMKRSVKENMFRYI